MTFDSGILSIYRMQNTARPGYKPTLEPVLVTKYYYQNEQIGITRYYQSLQAQAKVDWLVSIPGWDGDVSQNDICVLDAADGGKQYRIDLIQPTLDESNLKIRKLTLIRLGEDYAIST